MRKLDFAPKTNFLRVENYTQPNRSSLLDKTRAELALVRARWLIDLLSARSATPIGDLFGDPAWVILLDLFVREADGKSTTISSACVGSMAPGTTALRWITWLVERNLLNRERDPADRRIVYLELTDEAKHQLVKLLGALR